MAIPSIVMMIVSGIYSSKENAQTQVSAVVGIYAGITVFTLTIQWGTCVIFGRRSDLKQKTEEHRETSQSSCFPAKEKLMILKDSAVVIDKETRYTAGIMLLSFILYVIVQLADFFNISTAKSIITLIALIISSLSLFSYFAYQILDPWMQQRSYDYSRCVQITDQGVIAVAESCKSLEFLSVQASVTSSLETTNSKTVIKMEKEKINMYMNQIESKVATSDVATATGEKMVGKSLLAIFPVEKSKSAE